MLVTARAGAGPADARGVIGPAWSDDLGNWAAGPPLSAPGEFRHLEVPQRVWLGGAWRILVGADDHGVARRGREGFVAECGTHYLSAAERQGPYALDRDDFFVGDPERGALTPAGCSSTKGPGSSSRGACTARTAASSASSAIRCPSR